MESRSSHSLVARRFLDDFLDELTYPRTKMLCQGLLQDPPPLPSSTTLGSAFVFLVVGSISGTQGADERPELAHLSRSEERPSAGTHREKGKAGGTPGDRRDKALREVHGDGPPWRCGGHPGPSALSSPLARVGPAWPALRCLPLVIIVTALLYSSPRSQLG